jgi:hypothetical protein
MEPSNQGSCVPLRRKMRMELWSSILPAISFGTLLILSPDLDITRYYIEEFPRPYNVIVLLTASNCEPCSYVICAMFFSMKKLGKLIQSSSKWQRCTKMLEHWNHPENQELVIMPLISFEFTLIKHRGSSGRIISSKPFQLSSSHSLGCLNT